MREEGKEKVGKKGEEKEVNDEREGAVRLFADAKAGKNAPE